MLPSSPISGAAANDHRRSVRVIRRRAGLVLLMVLASVAVAACGGNMRDQPRFEPYEPSQFFPDNQSARPIIKDTVPRGTLKADTELNTGKGADGKDLQAFPIAITKETLLRGRERYGISCTPCHGQVGDGLGIVVRRGFMQPPSFHQQRLRDAPPGYIYGVITNGFGAMPPYADQVAPEDRWAIVAYIRALQLSQNATINDVPPDDRAKIGTQPANNNPEGGTK